MTDLTYEEAMDAKVFEILTSWRAGYRCLLGPWRIKPLWLLMTAALEWKPQDVWIGLFWKRSEFDSFHSFNLWVCIIPCVPLHLWWYRRNDS